MSDSPVLFAVGFGLVLLGIAVLVAAAVLAAGRGGKSREVCRNHYSWSNTDHLRIRQERHLGCPGLCHSIGCVAGSRIADLLFLAEVNVQRLSRVKKQRLQHQTGFASL